MSGYGIEPLTDVYRAVGVVTADTGGDLTVDTGGEVVTARRAVSCLVQPEVGDRVLLAGEGDLFVISVLERAHATATKITMDGDVAIGIRKGRLTMAAEEGLHLVSSKDLSLTSDELRVRATEGHVVLDRLFHIGERVITRVKRVKLVAEILDTVAERLSQRVERSYRFVSEMDYVRAREMDLAADKTVSLRGENTLVTAKKLVKFDGEQIHVG